MTIYRTIRQNRGIFFLCVTILTLVLIGWFAAPPLLLVGNARTPITILDAPIPLAAKVLTPSADGTVTYTGGGATIDASNRNSGYIMVKFSGGGKIKLQIEKAGGKKYTYDLNSGGKYEVFPLSSGNGTYDISVYENVSGNQYALAKSATISVELENSMLPFLYPNQFVNFSASSAVVKKSDEIVAGADGSLAKVSCIYNYVIRNISYDTKKAQAVVAGQMTGYVPKVDSVLEAKKGICFDYAALMAAMLRSQGIPTRLEVGHVSGGAYHAWISVYVAETGAINEVIQFDGKSWKMMDPTFASSGGGSSEIMKYIGNGSNYSTSFYY